MAITVEVPISSEVIEENARCIVGTDFQDGAAHVYFPRRQNSVGFHSSERGRAPWSSAACGSLDALTQGL